MGSPAVHALPNPTLFLSPKPKQIFFLYLRAMAASKEETLKQTFHVVSNFSKFVEESGLPCAALLLRAFDFGASLLESESDLRSCLKSRIETVVHVNYDDTELENKVLSVTLSGGVKRIQWDLEGIYNWEAMGDIWVKQDGEGFIWSEGLGFWRIGKVLSGKKGGIASLCSGATGPEKVKTWNYWNGEKWITTPNVSDRVTISLDGNQQHKEALEKTKSIQDYIELQYRRLLKEYNQKLKKEFIQQESLFFSLINFKFENEFSSIAQELTTGLAKIETFCKKFYPLHLRESPANVDEVVNLIERNEDILVETSNSFSAFKMSTCMSFLAGQSLYI